MTRVDYPLRLFLDCSTVHLSSASHAYLELHAAQGEELVATTPYGWFIWVGEGELEDLPADLASILGYARHLGAEYVLFDRDAPENEVLAAVVESGATDPRAGPARRE